MKRFLSAVTACAVVAVVSTAAASTPWSIVSAYKGAERSGFGHVIEAKQLANGAAYLYTVEYGRPSKKIALCTGEQLVIGSPLVFVLGDKLSHRRCPAESYFVPSEDMRTFLLPGIQDLYSKRAFIRVEYPHGRSLGCAMNTVTVSETRTRTGTQSEIEFGPFDMDGKYFAIDDFMNCVNRKD
ncbi:hypothetical protein [Noviluteimonas gilva]|uniref:Uncharacterized protein n=1 Tax=Noviluteimonas gilva TaxID=2682097 RepID=A0A7C9HP18_9GAMM|nr:hypothetical protein [Lysobacter gilvus]MUV15795.1 hypothetical protein [Lysobacter gilvus]